MENINSILKASYQNQEQAENTLSKKGYKYDTELSSPDTKVFVDEYGNPNVVFRGTHRAEDWITNAKIAVGIPTQKEKEARETVKKIEQKYGKPVNAYGHSQGGFVSEHSGASGNIYTYNKATSFNDIVKPISKKQTDIRTKKDIVSSPSIFQTGGTKINISSPLFSSVLKEHSLTPLKKLGKGNSFFNNLW